MADTRTRHDLTQNAWTLVVNGGTAATIYNADPGATYYSMIYDDAVSDPNASVSLPETAQEMFLQNNRIEEFQYPTAAYVWVTPCFHDGAVIVTE